MAEAFAAVGFASSLITFVDVSVKVLARLREYHSTTQEIPRVLRDITTQLPLMIDIMKRIKSGCADGSLSTDTQHALSKAVEGCLTQITLLDGLVETTLPASTDSVWQRRQKEIRSIRKEKDVATIQRTLETYKSTLTLHFSQESRASITNAAMETGYFELPPLQVSCFVERVELLEEIRTSFAHATEGAAHPKIIVLLGMGGLGKTQLALEYCRRARTSGEFQAIFWIDASSPNTVARGFEAIATRISSPGLVFDDIESKIAFVKKTMGSWHIPWLMVFDNYDRPDQFRDITSYLPQGESGAFLFISRHTDSERLGVVIKVTQMAEEEGLELLLSQSKLERSDGNVVKGKKIIQRLGYLPLAIDQAGAYISARKLPLELYIQHYNERREAVLQHTPTLWEYPRRRYKDAEAMYDRALMEKEKALGPDHTSTLDTVNGLGNLYEAEGKLSKAQTMYNHAVTGFEKVLGPDHTSRLDTANNLGVLYKSQGRLIEAEVMYNYALTEKEKALGPDHTSTLDTVNGLGNLYEAEGKLSEAETMYNRAVTGFEKALGSDHTSTLDTANNLGVLYKSQGRLMEAEAMYNYTLTGKEEALGPDHTSTLDTVNDLGNLYEAEGKLSEAETMYNRAVTGFEKALGPDHTSTLDTVNNLGVLYKSQGRLMEAEAMYSRALTGYEKVLGSDHRSTLQTVRNLGHVYKAQGRLTETEVMYNRALTGYEKALRPDHTSTLRTVHNLGELHEAQGRQAEAGDSIAQLREEIAALRTELTSLRDELTEPPHVYDSIHHEDSTYSSESAPSGPTLCAVVGTSPGSPLGLNLDPDPDQDVKNGEETPTSAQNTPNEDKYGIDGLTDRSGDFGSAQACQSDVPRPRIGLPFPASLPDIRSICAVKLRIVKNNIRNTMSSYFRPPVLPGCERIRWTCACGLLMYSDIKDPEPGVAELLEADLSKSAAAAADSPDLPVQINSTFTLQQRSTGASRESSDERPQSPRSPLTSPDLLIKAVCSPSTSATASEEKARFLLVCINATTYEIHLEQIPLATVGHDQVLFSLIRDAYYKLSRSWLSKLTFLTPVSVELVEFELVPPPEGQGVGIIKVPSLPPVEEVQVKESYHYAPCPLEPPAIPKNYFMHIFHNPGKHTLDFWLRRLPKKLKTKLAYTTDPLPIGWGVQIIEGPNIFLINCTLGLVLMVASIWMAAMKDVSGGTGLGQLLVVVLVAAVTWNLQQWRS